jgi:transposase
MVGLKRRQSQVLWKTYRTQGLAGLLTSHYHGSWAKLYSQQQARLLQRLDGDDMASQQQLIDWVQAETGIGYSQSGMSMLLSRLKVKLKTGRPVNVHKDVVGEMVFKKSFPS